MGTIKFVLNAREVEPGDVDNLLRNRTQIHDYMQQVIKEKREKIKDIRDPETGDAPILSVMIDDQEGDFSFMLGVRGSPAIIEEAKPHFALSVPKSEQKWSVQLLNQHVYQKNTPSDDQ